MSNTKFQFKRTTISGRLPNTTISANTSYIDAGEFAINLADGKVVSSNGTVTFEVGANLSSLNVATSIAVGGATINSTIYSATANNANNLGGLSLGQVQGNAAANAATAYTNATIYSANASNLGNGTVAPARLGSGTANSTTVLYGNSVWAGLPTFFGSAVVSQQFTANGTANSFTISGGYTANQVAVFVNGVKQLPATDVDITSGTTINLASTPLNGYAVDVFGYNTVVAGSVDLANTATYLSNSSGTLVNIQNYITGNAATAYTNATSYADTKAANAYTNATTYVTTGGYTISGVVNYSGNVILTSGNGTNQLLIGTINATSIGLLANSTILTIGNSSVNTTVNATSFSGIANNANNLGGTSLATLQTQITGNAATAYTNATSYADTKAGTAYTNATSYADIKAGNAYTNAASYADTKAGTAYTNATSYADTKAGNAYTNATTYVTTGGYTISGVVTHSGNVILTSGNATNRLLIGTINATSIGMLANSTVLTVGNSSVNTTINSTALTTISNTATFGTAAYIIANGNVGIGTSGPARLLEVLATGSAIPARLGNALGNLDIGGSDGGVVNLDTRSWAMGLQTGGVERMRITTGGLVGIGTASPTGQLTVQGAGQATPSFNTAGALGGALVLDDTGGVSNNGGTLLFAAASGTWRFAAIKGLATNGANNSQGDIAFLVRPTATDATLTEAMRVTSAGNVGIGTNSPICKFHVAGGSGSTIRNTASAGSSWFVGSNIDAYILHNESNTPMLLTTNGAERMRIDSAGNVGIGTSTPGSKLTISGGVSSFEALLEKATVSATAATGTVHLDVLTQAVLYYTSNATANFTLNVRANNTVTANSILVNGQSLTVAFLNTTGATAYYPNVFSIDSTTVTPKFSGGTAYIAGNANSIDTYTYTIIKTANSTYTVLANQTQYK